MSGVKCVSLLPYAGAGCLLVTGRTSFPFPPHLHLDLDTFMSGTSNDRYHAVMWIWTFFPDLDRTFFFSPNRPNIRIRSGKSRSGSMEKKRPKTASTSRKIVYFILSTLNTVLFGQVPPKPRQNII